MNNLPSHSSRRHSRKGEQLGTDLRSLGAVLPWSDPGVATAMGVRAPILDRRLASDVPSEGGPMLKRRLILPSETRGALVAVPGGAWSGSLLIDLRS